MQIKSTTIRVTHCHQKLATATRQGREQQCHYDEMPFEIKMWLCPAKEGQSNAIDQITCCALLSFAPQRSIADVKCIRASTLLFSSGPESLGQDHHEMVI
eukprot:2236110-Amphidinium_carterae.1